MYTLYKTLVLESSKDNNNCNIKKGLRMVKNSNSYNGSCMHIYACIYSKETSPHNP